MDLFLLQGAGNRFCAFSKFIPGKDQGYFLFQQKIGGARIYIITYAKDGRIGLVDPDPLRRRGGFIKRSADDEQKNNQAISCRHFLLVFDI